MVFVIVISSAAVPVVGCINDLKREREDYLFLIHRNCGPRMNFRHRPMTPNDVQECVEIVAAHPVIGPRYGSAIQYLGTAWLRLLESEAKIAVVIENVEGSRRAISFVGVTVFVTDDFVREIKTPPLRWFGPELAKRVSRGDSPILHNKHLRDANACLGLNAMVWEGCPHPNFIDDTRRPRVVMDAFIETHRGFRLKELISVQVESAERLEFVLKSGAFLWDPVNGRYVKSLHNHPREIVSKPHLAGVTRELERSQGPWGASWVGRLFEYEPPRCSFSPSEQRLLELALAGDTSTNEELADALGISLPTVKKLWQSIYRRGTEGVPELRPDAVRADIEESTRGKEKRRRLLAYLRDHPEELRPINHKLLAQFHHKFGRSAPA